MFQKLLRRDFIMNRSCNHFIQFKIWIPINSTLFIQYIATIVIRNPVNNKRNQTALFTLGLYFVYIVNKKIKKLTSQSA